MPDAVLYYLPRMFSGIFTHCSSEDAGVRCPETNNWSGGEKGFKSCILVPMEADPETNIREQMAPLGGGPRECWRAMRKENREGGSGMQSAQGTSVGKWGTVLPRAIGRLCRICFRDTKSGVFIHQPLFIFGWGCGQGHHPGHIQPCPCVS